MTEMHLLFMAFRDSTPLASQPSALGTLNTLGLAVFLIGVGLMLLISAHYYRQRGMIDRKHKYKRRYGSSSAEYDPVYQLQFMSRDELREMVLKEREGKEAATGKSEEPEAPPLIELGTAEGGTAEEPAAEQPDKRVDESEEVRPEEAPAPRESSEAAVLAQLGMAGATEDGTEPEEQPKPKHHDQVQRSALSNELPEEFRRKSRKI